MDLLSLVAKLSLDSSEYEQGIEQSGEKARSLGDAVKKGFGIAAKAGMAALGAATTAAGVLAKSAVSSYSSYEQLVGGVDKLYGDASSRLQQYADKAYLTAGMSANAYMETATSFSAALINSLSGDTKKAADITDVAMRAMSDNVNVFGSSMESVQNAFQGFAKGNYTMLDNLKLGYGGTKEEMERLIADANTYRKSIGESADLSIDSFADIVQAIQSVQEKQNIAGTTNKEAMKTIEGSANATKAAWENVITAIGRGEGLKDAMAGLSSAIFGEAEGEGLLNQVIPRIQTTLEGIADLVVTAGPMISEKIPEIAGAVIPSLLKTGASIITTLGSALPGLGKSLLSSIRDVALSIVREFSTAILGYDVTVDLSSFLDGIYDFFGEKIPNFIEKGIDAAQGFITGVLESAPDAIESAGEIIEWFILGITEGASKILGSIYDLMENLKDGIDSGDAGIMESITSLMTRIIEIIVEQTPKLVTRGFRIVYDLITGILSAVPNVLTAASSIVQYLITTIMNEAPQFIEQGIYFISSLASGIISSIPEIISTITEVVFAIADTLLESAPDLIDSGIQIILNLVDGIVQAIPELLNIVIDVWEQFIESLSENFPTLLQKGVEIIQHIASGIASALPTIIQAALTLVSQIGSTISSRLPSILATGMSLVISLAGGILRNLPTIIATAIRLIASVASTIIQNLPRILQTGIQLIGQLAMGIIRGVPKLIGQIPKILQSIAKSFTSFNWSGIGSQVINGIANGIRNGIGKIASAAKDAAKSAFNAAKNFLGIKSPSRLFRDKIGAMMAKGMEIGFEQEFDPDDYADAIESIRDLGGDYSNDVDRETVTIDRKDDTRLIEEIRRLYDAILRLKIYLDKDEVVGIIVDPINQALGRKAVIAGRS